MRNHICRFLAVFALALSGACGPSLDVQLVQAAQQRPSNVAVYFTVDDNEGNPVPGLTATDFRIYEDGNLVSVDESQQTIINPEVAAEHYTLLLVDMSASVTESDQVPLIEQAAAEFTATLQGQQKVGVYAFDGSEEIHVITPFREGGGGVGRISGFRARDPSTNLHGAIVQATAALTAELEQAQTPLTFGTIVVFTDGTDRAARVSYRDMMNALDDVDYDVFVVGVGNEIDPDTLARIGFSGYVLVQDSSAITAAFQTLSERILGYTKRFYLLSYCTPARAGEHDVTIEAVRADGAVGELTHRFDATDFGPNCDPNRPPPFDTSGRARRVRRRPRPQAGARIEVSAEASGGGGASAGASAGAGNPEGGDY